MDEDYEEFVEVGKRYRIWIDGSRITGEVMEIRGSALLIKFTGWRQRNRKIWVNMNLVSTIGEVN